MGGWEVQTIRYKMGSAVHCATQGTEPIFCHNRKWNRTFKNCIKINLKN